MKRKQIVQITSFFVSIWLIVLSANSVFGASIKVACVGNSITWGWDLSDRNNQSYPAVLQTLLGSQYTVMNFGTSGCTMLKKGDMPYWDDVNFTASTDFKPDIVVIMLGSNDAKPQNWIHKADFVADYNSMIDHYRTLGSLVYVATPPPVYADGNFGITPAVVNEIVPLVREVAADTNAPLIDVYTALSGKPSYFPDNVHPNADGCSLIAQTVANSLASEGVTAEAQLKPRIIVLTDISTWEPDDHESLIRFLVHADLFEIEGIVWTTGYSHSNIASHPSHYDIIHGVIDSYELDLPNLLKRSGQIGHAQDSTNQEIGYWPSPDYLRERTMWGSERRGMQYIGASNNSNGSNLIIDQADEDDDRPIWVTIWGGGNTLAQAIWQVQQTRSEEELKTFLNKIHAYAITDQDRHYDGSEGYEVSCHQWLRREFADDLLFIWDECAWKYQNDTGVGNWSQYVTHIQGHGSLGSQYPEYEYGVEGDTPAFLHLLPNGLNNPNDPNQCGWGGYSAWGIGPDNKTFAYNNHAGTAYSTCTKYENHFYAATFNNFAARMDWAQDGTGNQNPVVVINGDTSLSILTITPKPDSTLVLDASATFDPDDDALTFNWWIQPEAGTYSQSITITNNDSSVATVNVPSDSDLKTFHVICEVTDSGTHNLSSYRRIIVKPSVTGTDTSVNRLPVAYAGPNQIVTDTDEDSMETVILYGSGSNDFDGSITTYVWREDTNVIATSAITSVDLSVGEHIITLTVTDDEGATDTDDVIITIKARPVGVNYLYPESGNILVYPNPADNVLKISFPDSKEMNCSLSIYNSNGKLIKYVSALKNVNSINISGMHPGQYFLVVDNINNRICEKLIIK